jgi:hypothetical protein
MRLILEHKSRADFAELCGYLPVYRSVVQEMCAPIWWHGTDEDGKYRILHNATVCFVDTGAGLIAVTAAHVLNAYISQKRDDSNITCQLGGITYNPEDHVIDLDDRLDLATFRVSSVVVAGARSSCSRPATWPPVEVMAGDVLLCGGYPGAIRSEQESTATLPFQWFLASASDVTNENVVLALDTENCHVPLSKEPIANGELGGMSGGPVFKYLPPSPVERIELVGFIYQFQPHYRAMCARPTNRVDKHGFIWK